MKRIKVLSGEELLAKGATKKEANLPEVGLKDVIPNGSWLELKQIQAAIESRKHLVEVPRIEKRGVLSEAEWNDELKLARVTKFVGSHWQYVGHCKSKNTYIHPEEALYLIETNCLKLNYNEVIVSLQQAYSLLLKCTTSILLYKVYASLSRIGYKIIRHKKEGEEESSEEVEPELTEYEKKLNFMSYTKKSKKPLKIIETRNNNNVEVDKEIQSPKTTTDVSNTETSSQSLEQSRSNVYVASNQINEEQGTSFSSQNSALKTKTVDFSKHILPRKKTKLQVLLKRQNTNVAKNNPDKFFDMIPEMCQKKNVDISIPDETHLPRNIFLNKTSYSLNLDSIKNKVRETPQRPLRTYSLSDEANDANVMRLQNSARNSQNYQNNYNHYTTNFPRLWNYGPRNYVYNFMFQRPYFPNQNFPQRIPLLPRPPGQFYGRIPRLHWNNRYSRHPPSVEVLNRKRSKSGKQSHLENIKRLAHNLKQLILNGNMHQHNLLALQRLINTYNVRYKDRLRLTNTFDLINDEIIVDTIELDDDEPQNKKSKNNKFEENLKKIKDLAVRYGDLAKKGKATSRHRRAFSNMISKFNKTYNADIYFNSNNEIIDRRLHVIESSESDCILDESTDELEVVNTKSNKKLINPFNLLKRQSIDNPSSKSSDINTITPMLSGSPWCPKEDDFGRAELLTKIDGEMFALNLKDEEYIFDFIPIYKSEFNSWLDLKISFWESIDVGELEIEQHVNEDIVMNSLLKPDDCKEAKRVLEKLRIIESCNTILDDTELVVHFDVYNRDVANFRKTDLPQPHFRLLCIDEKEPLPSGDNLATLYSKYDDKIPIVVAVVGIGSINYLQMRPTELPVYTGLNEDENNKT